MDNKPSATDEIALVNHLHQVVCDGLLGRNSLEIFVEEPKRRILAGVLFPSDDFIRRLPEENTLNVDPQPQYLSIARNVNQGIEFLVHPENGVVSLLISGVFTLFVRVFPTYKEQLPYLEHLMKQVPANEVEVPESGDDADEERSEMGNTDEDGTPEHQKGLALLEKYRRIDIRFNGIKVKVDCSILESQTIDLLEVINAATSSCESWDDVFCVRPELIQHTGAVPMEHIPQSEMEFLSYLHQVKSDSSVFPDWNASINIDPREYRDRQGQILNRISVTLINVTPTSPPNSGVPVTGHPSEFFDCQMSVTLIDGQHVPYEFDGAPDDYRTDKRFDVRGVNCVGVRDLSTSGVVLRTETIPAYFQTHYRTREDYSVLFDDLTMPGQVIKGLSKVSQDMKAYREAWTTFILNRGDIDQPLRTDAEVTSCKRDLEEFEAEIASFDLGIYALERDSRLMRAFTMMNEVFARAGAGRYVSWRLFQIVFIVRILPSLLAREVLDSDPRKDEIISSSEFADVLWFPTGGGKTEAYLGVITTSLFYDRLRGKKVGCSAWIRFPLRMLSKQQLDRLARILIYAEEYREQCAELSGDVFSIGFFAGSGNTDNFLSKKSKDRYFSSERSKQKRMLLHRCPHCGMKLNLEFNEHRWLIEHRCVNPGCFVAKSPLLQGVVPVYTTDSEIYRFVPSVICGTVDKLAILSRYREFSHLFGQVNGRCSKHGYFSDRCIVGAYDEWKSCDEKAKSTKTYQEIVRNLREPFYDPVPALLIQDELHLLKEELGALDGHYEGALQEFSRIFGHKPSDLPKVIAATATIEAYERHINHLYVRRARRYPSAGYKPGESFYATSKPTVDRRLYLGILPHTKALDEVINRCLLLYNLEIMRLYQDADAWSRFESSTLVNREAFLSLLTMYDLSSVYVNQKGMARDVSRRLMESTDVELRKLWKGSEPFEYHAQVLTGDNDMDVISETIDRVDADTRNRRFPAKLHSIIATSLISHGVDLERINAFFMAGMPSKQAEYIQASSRSARSHAGMVFCVFRPNDLRERSQYQYFIQNHTFLNHLVDPVPINRLTSKVIERTVPGLLAGLLLCVHSQRFSSTIYNCKAYRDYCADMTTKGIDVRRELIGQLQRMIGVDWNYFPLVARQKADAVIKSQFEYCEHLLQSSAGELKIKDERVLNPLTSFRDIEEGIPLMPATETGWILASVESSFHQSQGK